MWNSFLRRIELRGACVGAAFALFLGPGASAAALAGEVLGVSVETSEIHPRAVVTQDAEAVSARPIIHENRLDELDVYALSPGAIHLRLPLTATPPLFAENIVSQRPDDGAAASWRLSGWANIIDQAAREFDVDPALIAAVIQAESAFQARAVSEKGAQGLMQLMPATGREMGLDDPFEPAANIRAGTRYLKRQLMNFASSEEALAAYNAGPGSVLKYGGIPPFAETRNFVRRVAGHWQAARLSAERPPQAGTVRAEEQAHHFYVQR
jgi:soluble lytic murein transglycosylase-like protein